MIHLEATALAAAIAAAAVVLGRLVEARARHRTLARASSAPGDPHVIYFSGPSCSVCTLQQEPALRKLEGVTVRKVDAVAEPEVARDFNVYTVPTTVVIGRAGLPLHVNYGFAPAELLRRQLYDG